MFARLVLGIHTHTHTLKCRFFIVDLYAMQGEVQRIRKETEKPCRCIMHVAVSTFEFYKPENPAKSKERKNSDESPVEGM